VSQGGENRCRIVQPQSHLQFVNGVSVLGLAFIGPTKNAVRQPEVWVHFERLPEIRDGVVEPPLGIVWQSRLHVDDERERIQLQRLPIFDDGVFLATHESQILCIPLVSGSIAWTDLEGSLEFSFRPSPVPVIPEFHIGEGGVPFREFSIQFESS
jgi:hypothetical protein